MQILNYVCSFNLNKFGYISLQTFQLGFQTGFLRSISNEMKVSIADHFFLGGPLNLRGFEMRGCGPQKEGNAIGADFYWASALHLYTPLPFRPSVFGDRFKLHGFINGGTLMNFSLSSGNFLIRFITRNVKYLLFFKKLIHYFKNLCWFFNLKYFI